MPLKCHLIALLAAVCVLPAPLSAQKDFPTIEAAGPARQPNVDGVYQSLRRAQPMGAACAVEGLTLKRQGGEFRFRHGSMYVFGPVNGAVTGAVFLGEGSFQLSPAEAREQHSLALLSKSESLSVDFTTLVMRFSDNTAAEIATACKRGDQGGAEAAVKQATGFARASAKELHENVALRLLQDVATPGEAGAAGQFFLASFRMGGMLTGRNVLFVVDPEGTWHAKPDQVELSTWDSEGVETWAAYRMTGAGAARAGSEHVTAERLDVSFEKSGTLHGSAEVQLGVTREGLRVAQFALFPTLRVSGVYDEKGQPLDFVQEGKDDDPQLGVLLPEAPKAGSALRLLVKYAGPQAVLRDGDGTYYLQPAARERWYPASDGGLGDFATFRMVFHLPKGLQIVATGKQISSEPEPGGGTRVVWASETPIAVAGFNLGEFRSGEVKTPAGFSVNAYANSNLPDSVTILANRGLGTLSTVPALKDELSQGSAAIQVYSRYFGNLPYDHVALTQQSACSFGQSWPMLVYLPMCGFWDSTVQHAFGLLDSDPSYWHEVTPHEVSHQWWGQLVGFNNYRDQWMSEGFANYSVSLYIRSTAKNPDEYRSFWREQLKRLTEKNERGLRPVDVGPVTMGYRVNTSKTGADVAQSLIYSKGAYILHMLEMMYWTPAQGEELFKHAMQEFVKEYSGKAASTEDFKASLEKTMPQWVDIAGNGKLDWFFDEYVYGTEIPHYVLSSTFTQDADGSMVAHLHIDQSKVSKDFTMLVPLYLELQSGKTTRLGNMRISGTRTLEQNIKLGKMTDPPKRLLLNYNADVLSE